MKNLAKIFKVAVVTCGLAFALTLHAEMLPSFYLESCSWGATHVVVVTEGDEIDGRLTVLESWKGDLLPRQTIVVPELAAFRSEESRRVTAPIWWDDQDPLPYVSGARMILFLRETALPDRSKPATSQARTWTGANLSDIKVSVVWIDDHRPFAFMQVTNPGDTVLVSAGKSEHELWARFHEVDETHASLDRALMISDLAARAEALKPLVGPDFYYARAPVFAALGQCGRAGLPALRELLQDETLATVHADVIRTLAEISK